MGNNVNCLNTEKDTEDLDLTPQNDIFSFMRKPIKNQRINLSLFSLLKEKMNKLNISIKTITKEYINNLIEKNPHANSIIESYSPELKNLYNSTQHLTYLPPLQFINKNDNSIEYYEGEYNSEGEFNGIGLHLFDKNCIYIGQFEKDQYNGKGLLISNEGNSLYGDFIQGECTGSGHLTIIGQSDYQGEFNNNQKNGFGVEKYVDNSIYEGNFVNGDKCGQGKYTFSNGEYYEGNFKDDLYEGEGIYEWPEEGRKYQGQFHFGNIEGKGTTHYYDGSVYKGNYIGGIKEGEGTFIWNDGKTFVGTILTNILLQNMSENAQILIVCFTNHALDSFIEDISNYTNDIVRIGGRCQNEKVAEYKLQNKYKYSSEGYRYTAKQLDSIGENLEYVTSLIDNRRRVSIGNVKNYFPELYKRVINDFIKIVNEVLSKEIGSIFNNSKLSISYPIKLSKIKLYIIFNDFSSTLFNSFNN